MNLEGRRQTLDLGISNGGGVMLKLSRGQYGKLRNSVNNERAKSHSGSRSRPKLESLGVPTSVASTVESPAPIPTPDDGWDEDEELDAAPLCEGGVA